MDDVAARLASDWPLIAGIGLGLIGLVTVIWMFSLLRKPNALDYSVEVSRGLASQIPSARSGGRVEVQFNGMLLRDPHFVNVQIRNAGRFAIERSDFLEGIQITWSDAHFVSVQGDTPVDVLDPLDSKLLVVPDLINAGEVLNVSFIVDGQPDDVQVKATFFNQTRPMRQISKGLARPAKQRAVRTPRPSRLTSQRFVQHLNTAGSVASLIGLALTIIALLQG